VIKIARKRIAGITISLDGETKGLDKALQDVNKRSRDLSSELREVENALKFNPGNVELLAQKQQLLTQQVENTSEKLERLKSVQDQVQQQFNKGEIGADQYRAFQREIIKTESQLDGFKKALASVDDNKALDNLGKDFQNVRKDAEKAKEEIKNVGSEIGNFVAGAVAGGGIAGAVSQALDTSSLNTKIEISMDVPPESIKSVKEAINTVSAYGVDAESALEGVRRQWALNADASDEANARIVEGAGVIASSYEGIDFTELIQEINEISGELNITNEEALGLTNALLKVGFPPEQLDIIAEYGQQLVRAGYTAEEVQAIMAAGVDTGTWNIDKKLSL
jgi:phage-related minor tail protein